MEGLAESFLDCSLKVWRTLSTSRGTLGVFSHHISRDFRYKHYLFAWHLISRIVCVYSYCKLLTPLTEFVYILYTVQDQVI